MNEEKSKLPLLYKLRKVNGKIIVDHIPTGHCMTIEDIFHPKANYRWLKPDPTYWNKGSGQRLCKVNGSNSNRGLFKKIFKYFLKLVIEHVIDTGDVFRFPVRNRVMQLMVERIPDDVLKKLKARGFYEELNLIASNFKMYHLVLRTERRYFITRKIIRLPYKYKMRLINHINNGKVYSDRVL